MGSSGLVSEDKQKVEYTSLTQLFEEQCPIYMSYGMSYDEFWYGDLYRTKFYREAYKIKIRQQDEGLWMQGMYIYEALCDVSPILHAFSKKGTKPLQYSKAPYLSNVDNVKTEQEKKQSAENERLKAILHFNNWAKVVGNHFKSKQGGD